MFSIQEFTELPDQHFFPGYDSELVHALLCSTFSAQARALMVQMLLFYTAINISATEERSKTWFTWNLQSFWFFLHVAWKWLLISLINRAMEEIMQQKTLWFVTFRETKFQHFLTPGCHVWLIACAKCCYWWGCVALIRPHFDACVFSYWLGSCTLFYHFLLLRSCFLRLSFNIYEMSYQPFLLSIPLIIYDYLLTHDH